MRKLLLQGTAIVSAIFAMSAGANAADMAVKAPPPAPLPVLFSWTGFYLGGNLGGAWAERHVNDAVFGIDIGRSSDAVFIGGGQLGYNWQFNNFVLGIEGDIDGIANNGNGRSVTATVPGVGPVTVTGGRDARWVSTLAARFGFANDHWLFYGKAGGGWVSIDRGIAITNVNTGNSIFFGDNNIRSGFLVGAGIEYAFTNNWTVKGEYDYLGLGSGRSFVVPVGSPFLAGDTFAVNNRSVQMFKIGFNYLFR